MSHVVEHLHCNPGVVFICSYEAMAIYIRTYWLCLRHLLDFDFGVFGNWALQTSWEAVRGGYTLCLRYLTCGVC